jgi:hypothetical protein
VGQAGASAGAVGVGGSGGSSDTGGTTASGGRGGVSTGGTGGKGSTAGGSDASGGSAGKSGGMQDGGAAGESVGTGGTAAISGVGGVPQGGTTGDSAGAAGDDAELAGAGGESTNASSVVDQANVMFRGWRIYDGADQVVGQTFTVGVAGLLTMIDVSPAKGPGVEPTDSIELVLTRCTDIRTCSTTPLGSVTLFAADFKSGEPIALVPGSPGAGAFDVSSLGVVVAPGEIYRFMLVPHLAKVCPPEDLFCWLPTFLIGQNDEAYIPGELFLYDAQEGIGGDLYFVTYVRP